MWRWRTNCIKNRFDTMQKPISIPAVLCQSPFFLQCYWYLACPKKSYPGSPMKKLPVLAIGLLLVVSSGAQNASPGWGEAVWIWDQPDADKTAQSNEPRYVRRTFTLAAKPVKADLWITADNHYTAYLNGHK